MAIYKAAGRLNLADGSHKNLGHNPILETSFLNGKINGNKSLHLKECNAAGQVLQGGRSFAFFPNSIIEGVL